MLIFHNIEIVFGNIDPKGEIMGLVGLDLLNRLKVIIDVEVPSVYESNKKG